MISMGTTDTTLWYPLLPDTIRGPRVAVPRDGHASACDPRRVTVAPKRMPVCRCDLLGNFVKVVPARAGQDRVRRASRPAAFPLGSGMSVALTVRVKIGNALSVRRVSSRLCDGVTRRIEVTRAGRVEDRLDIKHLRRWHVACRTPIV